jgi:hypothetical protein
LYRVSEAFGRQLTRLMKAVGKFSERESEEKARQVRE